MHHFTGLSHWWDAMVQTTPIPLISAPTRSLAHSPTRPLAHSPTRPLVPTPVARIGLRLDPLGLENDGVAVNLDVGHVQFSDLLHTASFEREKKVVSISCSSDIPLFYRH